MTEDQAKILQGSLEDLGATHSLFSIKRGLAHHSVTFSNRWSYWQAINIATSTLKRVKPWRIRYYPKRNKIIVNYETF